MTNILDQSAADRVPVQRKRKIGLNGMLLDDKNRNILESVVVFGWLKRSQLSGLSNIPAVTIHRRAKNYASVRLLNERARGAAGEILLTPIRKGMQLVGMSDLKIPTPSPQTMNYTEGLFALALRFGKAPIRHVTVSSWLKGSLKWRTTGQLSRRIQHLAPWAQSQFEGKFALWKPVAGAISGSGNGFKRPDMLLLQGGLPPTAVELEITQKSSIRQYVRILEAYNRAQKAGDFADPNIYVTVEVTGNHNDIKKALQTAFTRTNLNCRMRPEFFIFNIGI